MREVAAMFSEQYNEVILYNEPDADKLPTSLKFRTPWPPTGTPNSEAAYVAQPRMATRPFASWTINLSDLGVEPCSLGGLLVAMRARVCRDKSQLTLSPGSCSADPNARAVQHYSLTVEWHGNSCELTFVSTRSRNRVATYWERKTAPISNAAVVG